MSYKNYGASSNNFLKNNQGKRNSFDKIRHNYSIKTPMCRVIEDGKSPTVMRTSEAITYAENLGLDLIEIGFDKINCCANCKLGDYSKYVYELKKQEKNNKKQARANLVETKTIQLSMTIDVADKERMINHALEFLKAGNKVKISLRFRNRRELENLDLAKDLMKEVLNHFNNVAILDSKPSLAGREMSCILRKA